MEVETMERIRQSRKVAVSATMKRWKRGLGVIAAAAVVLAASAAPANADIRADIGNGTGSCTSGYLCLWEDYNFHPGSNTYKYNSLKTNEGIPDFGKIRGHVASFNDHASSAYNNTNRTWCLYVDRGYTGRYLWIGPGWKGQLYSPWQDSISSVRLC
jgi:hypothetical protein